MGASPTEILFCWFIMIYLERKMNKEAEDFARRLSKTFLA
jgi:hypothetical protein